LGVALGGCRVTKYSSRDDQLTDALNLAKGMTYKNSLAGLDLGGGKATIDSVKADNETLTKFAEVMDYINKDGEVYITAGDVGTGPDEVAFLATQTKFVNGQNMAEDSGFATAYGVYMAMLGALNFQGRNLEDNTVVIEGLGKVGRRLANFIHRDVGRLVVSDINEPMEGVARLNFGADRMGDPQARFRAADVYAPCALGGTANIQAYNEMRTGSIVCGGANNQIPTDALERSFFLKGIITVPDYLANAGGVIIVSDNYQDLSWKHPDVFRKLTDIRHKTFDILTTSRDEGITPQQVANKMAEERLNA
jgi:glutamate dehydrogenase/leucine dehydrogenase